MSLGELHTFGQLYPGILERSILNIMSSTKQEDLKESESALILLGLEGLQARAYLCLLQEGSLSASQISQKIKVNRTDIYRILKTLSSRGLVNTIIQSPNLFEASKPEIAVRTLVAEMEEKVKQARKNTPDLIMSLNSIRNSQPQNRVSEERKEGGSWFKLLTGRQLIAAWKVLIHSARIDVLRVWTADGVRTNYSQGFIDDFADCVSRGVKIRAIAEINKSNLFECEEFAAIIDLRHLDSLSDAVRYEIADESEVIISSMNYSNEEPKLEGILTNNKVFVNGLRRDFEGLWRKAIPAKSRIEELHGKMVKKLN